MLGWKKGNSAGSVGINRSLWKPFLVALLSVSFLPTATTFSQENFWRQCAGPYGGGGINALAFDSNGDVFAAVASFGIYVSRDNGTTWIQDDSGLTDLNVQCLAALPGGGMLAGTFSGIFRSGGLGHGWTLVNNQFKFDINDSAGTAVNAMMEGPLDTVYSATSGGLMESTDSGATWSTLFTGQYSVNSLAISAGGRMYAGSNNFVLTSGDSGASWTSFPVGFAEIPRHYTISIAPLPDGNVAVSSTRDGIILFTSNGDTAKGYLTGVNAPGPGLLAACRLPGSDTSVDLYDGTYDGLYKLASGAANWSQVALDTADYAITALLCHGGTILVGTASHGLYRSTDYGATWTHPTYGMAALNVVTLVVDKSRSTNESDYVFAASNGNGIYRSTDNGDNWTSASTGLDGNADASLIYPLAVGPTGNIYTLTDNGIFVSTDEGVSWNSLNGAPSYSGGLAALNGNLPEDTLGLLLTLGIDGMYTSTDGGITWLVGTLGFDLQGGFVKAFAFLPSAGNVGGGYIFAGGGSIFRSSDNGGTWYLDIDGLGKIYGITSFCIPYPVGSNASSGEILAGTSYAQGVCRSTDFGLHWNSIGLSNRSIYCLASVRDGSIFAGTDSGVYRLIDPTASSWQPTNSGLIGSHVTSLVVDSLGFLYAATETGVFRSVYTITSITEKSHRISNDFVLNQNYPNPFNPSTIISYELSANSSVSLKVYDILGRRVAVLVDRKETAGTHTVTWNASSLASGVYFYNLTSISSSGTFTKTKAMILIK